MTPIAQTSTGFPCPATYTINHQTRFKIKLSKRTLLENLRRHILTHQKSASPRKPRLNENTKKTYTGRTANLGQQLELFLLHDTTETKIGNHDVGVFALGAENKVLGLEICNQGRNVFLRTGTEPLGRRCRVKGKGHEPQRGGKKA